MTNTVGFAQPFLCGFFMPDKKPVRVYAYMILRIFCLFFMDLNDGFKKELLTFKVINFNRATDALLFLHYLIIEEIRYLKLIGKYC